MDYNLCSWHEKACSLPVRDGNGGPGVGKGDLHEAEAAPGDGAPTPPRWTSPISCRTAGGSQSTLKMDVRSGH